MSDRVYSEEEVASLFERAAELQVQREAAARPAGAQDPRGLTFEEVAAIAVEAGLDPNHLRIAADELERSRHRRHARRGSTSSEEYAEYWIDGQLDESAIEDIVAELRHRYDSNVGASMGMPSDGRSTTETIGRSVEWRHSDPWSGNETCILLQPRSDAVRLRISTKNIWGMGPSSRSSWAFIGALIAGFIAAPLSGSYAVGLGVAVAMMVVLIPFLKRLEEGYRRGKEREMDGLSQLVALHVSPVALPDSQPQAGPAARLERPDSIEDESAAARPTRARTH